ncbi:hypothetical protein [Paeniglutamicibacter terrestris]|uniref:Permease n=1 Tax=Paeniglutamicibacter terrestris TaxID=2723403 RepID=A0ABX1G934_9MICC|nr:hypothetical protein [Paeniglutamicibacter terrestris]ASN38822.1 hypothetical protein CGQ24_07230 [Arthrobacter sp. 7749]NKG22155.1 hypothetical protein [Paeniglutamicibacter terrestris]
MSASQNSVPSSSADTQREDSSPRWGLRIGLGVAAVIILAIVYLVVLLFLPVWWATRVTNQTQGSVTSGIILGLTYGFVFTFVPLLIAWQARYKKVSWPWKAVIVVLAIIVAIPNLLTLSIYANSSGAAAKARSMIDISATWFPSWTMGGAAAALILFVGIATFWHLWRARGKKMKSLKTEMKSQATARAAESDKQAQLARDAQRSAQLDAQQRPEPTGLNPENPGSSN